MPKTINSIRNHILICTDTHSMVGYVCQRHPRSWCVNQLHPINHYVHITLKRKCRHFDEILITGCTGSCHFDNFQCSQWWKFHQNEDISVSVYPFIDALFSNAQVEAKWRVNESINRTTFVSNNGLTPVRCQANIWTSGGMLLNGSFGIFQRNLKQNKTILFNKYIFDMSSAKWRPSLLGLNVLECTNFFLFISWIIRKVPCIVLTGGHYDSGFRALMIVSRLCLIPILKQDLLRVQYNDTIIFVYLWNKRCLNLYSSKSHKLWICIKSNNLLFNRKNQDCVCGIGECRGIW